MNFNLFFSNDGVCQSPTNLFYPVCYEYEDDVEELEDLCRHHDVVMAHMTDASGRDNSVSISGGPVRFNFSNCAFMDVDDGKTILEIEKELSEVDYVLYTSKSHGVEKKGKLSDRFHVLFPLKRKITNKENYLELISGIIKHFKSDARCKNFDRKFYGAGNAKKFYFNCHKGKSDIVEFLEEKTGEKGKERIDEKIEEIDKIEISKDIKDQIQSMQFIPVSMRHNTMLKLAVDLVFALRSSREQAQKYLNEVNDNRCESKIPEKEITDILDWAFSVLDHKDAYHKTEEEMARLFCDLFGNLFRWSSEKQTWYFYNGKFWEVDVMLNLDRHIGILSYYLLAHAKQIEDKKERIRAVRWALSCGNRSKIRNIEAIARHKLTIRQEAFDTHKMLLNLENGTFNFEKMELQPFNREQYITKIAPVKFDKKAKCKKWMDTLEKMYEHESVKDYMQKALSITMTGKTYKAFHFLFGESGNNGKTTTLNTIKNILGSDRNGYCIDTPIDSLVYKRNDSEAGTYQARLQGARLIIATECNMRDTLHTTFIKSFTGGDSITAREKYARYANSFKPEGKLFISGNETLKINDASQAMWGRVRIIGYNKQIPKENIVADFWDVLYEEEGSGILNWLIEGYKKFKTEGLEPPEEVKKAVEEYKYDEDFLQQFIDDELQKTGNQEDQIRSSTLHEQFVDYAKKHSDKFNSGMSIQAFTRKMKNKGFKYFRDAKSRGFKGVKFNGNGENKF